MDYIIEIVLAALYLRGAPRPYDLKRSRWPMVERSLRIRSATLSSSSEALRSDGLWAEALVLEEPGLLSWAEEIADSGIILTPACDSYFPRWRERLGPIAPPALWIRGAPPAGPFLTIVGSRDVGGSEMRFAQSCASEALKLGYSVASGGAKGCDQAAGQGAIAEQLVEIVPFGLNFCVPKSPACQISLCAPNEEFTTGAAMERNTLLYGLSKAAIVVHARLKRGGTWHGAVEANRRRLTSLIVREDPDNPAHRALIALGAIPLRKPEELAQALQSSRLQLSFIAER